MAERVPVLKISLANATFLSGLYLSVAAGVEIIRRVWNPRWADPVSLSLEAFPARVLALLGLFEPLQTAWLSGHINELVVRLVYGVTVVGLIFAMGTLVGLLMALVARRYEGRSPNDAPP
jgi:hypothetical protein